MVGRHHLEIENRRVRYILDIERKVTVIKGNSGTGKTTLIRLLQGYLAQGRRSGIAMKNETGIPLAVFDMSTRWETELSDPVSRIIFIDEAVDYIYSKAFQKEVAASNHYLVVISRSGRFHHLPYAIGSIYELRTEDTDKIKVTRLYQLYQYEAGKILEPTVITEDSNSGAEMMQAIFDGKVIPAGGNGNVANVLADHIEEEGNLFAVVDGAAFGGFIAQLMSIAELNENVAVFAPESFEYMVLQTDAFQRKLDDELEHTWKYCDVSEYLTWEQYYTALLCKLCEEAYGFVYNKSHLHKSLLNDDTVKQVKNNLLKACVKKNLRNAD